MFEDYTTKQLLELRCLCAEIAEQADEVEERADALLVLEYIDKELTLREERQSA